MRRRRLFKSLKFGRPKNPGYGISRNFYLTVLAAKAPLPPIYKLVNPKGDHGAVGGFGVPLSSNACESLLHEPLSRGAYAVASRDRKTVLRCLVLSKEEAGFDPEVYASSSLASNSDPELVARLKATWSLVQLTFESHDPMVAPALDFLISFAIRVADLSDGVLADPIAGTYSLPHEVKHEPGSNRVDASLHVAMHSRPTTEGLNVYSMGMQKFGLPEFELAGVPPEMVSGASQVIARLSQSALDGTQLAVGSKIGRFQICEGGSDRAIWDGIACHELRPLESDVASCIQSWERESRKD